MEIYAATKVSLFLKVRNSIPGSEKLLGFIMSFHFYHAKKITEKTLAFAPTKMACSIQIVGDFMINGEVRHGKHLFIFH